jgi:hypothetical protein
MKLELQRIWVRHCWSLLGNSVVSKADNWWSNTTFFATVVLHWLAVTIPLYCISLPDTHISKSVCCIGGPIPQIPHQYTKYWCGIGGPIHRFLILCIVLGPPIHMAGKPFIVLAPHQNTDKEYWGAKLIRNTPIQINVLYWLQRCSRTHQSFLHTQITLSSEEKTDPAVLCVSFIPILVNIPLLQLCTCVLGTGK